MTSVPLFTLSYPLLINKLNYTDPILFQAFHSTHMLVYFTTGAHNCFVPLLSLKQYSCTLHVVVKKPTNNSTPDLLCLTSGTISSPLPSTLKTCWERIRRIPSLFVVVVFLKLIFCYSITNGINYFTMKRLERRRDMYHNI